ncbi:MAG: TM2 domain-containing protein [Candidatus Nanopelagicales bacterium]
MGDEPAQLHEAVAAATLGADPDMTLITAQRIEDLAAVLLAGRGRACLFCREPLAAHTLTISPDQMGIWCNKSGTSRPAAAWLAGPVPNSTDSVRPAGLMWIGVPGFSLGLLSWLPALVAGLRLRRRSWLIAAATFGVLTVVELVALAAEPAPVDESVTAATWLAVGLWLGSMIYGALQVKPWLASQPVPATAHSVTPKDTGIAYALMLISVIGVCGIQHFYLGKIGRGVLWLFTLGLFGVGLIIDLFTLPQQVNDVDARRAVGIK